MKTTLSFVDDNYKTYLSLLKKLVSINTVYTNEKGLIDALEFCKNHFGKKIPHFNTYFDKNHNLISIHPNIDTSKNIVYLSSHIDTVPADKTEWDKRYDPFVPYEDEEMIVGRGVNDDKAGVSYQLFLAQLLNTYFPKTTNIVFTISIREEQGGISAEEIGNQLGKKLPIGPKGYLLTLENCLKVTEPAILDVNYAERSAFGIEIKGTLQTIRDFLKHDKNMWNPTSIIPESEPKNIRWQTTQQTGGHASTYPRDKNLLYTLLFQENIDTLIVKGGSANAISVVPKVVQTVQTNKIINHTMVCDLRTLKRVPDITKELSTHNMTYRFVKKLVNAYDCKDALLKDPIYPIMQALQNNNLKLSFEPNPASTDTGRIYNSCSQKVKKIFLPLTMGPGCRSQRNTNPPRMTHGVNETFMKKPGFEAILFISKLLVGMKFLYS